MLTTEECKDNWHLWSGWDLMPDSEWYSEWYPDGAKMYIRRCLRCRKAETNSIDPVIEWLDSQMGK